MPYTLETIPCETFFDLELLMTLSQEKRLGGQQMENCEELWDQWSRNLKVTKIATGTRQYLLTQLGDEVEEFVDATWAVRPSDGHLYNCLAQALCMSVEHDLIPDVIEAGCAPSPKPTPELKEALEAVGVPYIDNGPMLSKRYAVLTNYPFKGGCEICAMFKDCPKGQGKASSGSSWVIPGFEAENQKQ